MTTENPVDEAHMKKVLIIVGAFPGPETKDIFGGVMASCQALLSAGIGEKFSLRLIDSSQRQNPPPGLLVRTWGSVSRVVRFSAALRQQPVPDSALIFLNEGLSFLEKSLLAVLAKRAGLKVTVAPRGGALRQELDDHRIMRAAARWMFNRVDHVICQGNSWVRLFSAYEAGKTGPEEERLVQSFEADVNAPKYICLFNWTATDEMLALGRERLASHETIKSHQMRILYVGSLMLRKGLVEMIEGFALALKSVPDMTLVLAGDGVADSELRALCVILGVEQRVTFLGWIELEQKLEELRLADCLCLASWSEGMPNAVIEAMACALPTIVTPVGGVPDAAPDGLVSLHVPVGDKVAIGTAFERLAADPALRRELGRQAHGRAEEQFTVQHAMQVLEEVL
ncbi:glycosyltransferase family 4 protein [Granulosicoccus antarcticus]|uniref:N-acetyl-alpha-D-glucosaminyl L-malate synthase n=1 Tax=Granulosicoccus antarcticus IMCC3135 TaxID=1192854 RepID=A0A2Z2NWX6_9GAMM|nr:glycosyltransferase family 4 protein [Granulosicoccus antarcticus]ASJ74501.1 N-acetyl-alpha-D-glucosaminyl L-malate synthase [Granulosicoccus antarcticus IMCC3135]